TGVEKVNAGMRAHVPGASSYQDHSASLTESGHSSRCHAEPWRKIARLEQHSTVAKSNIVGEMNIVGHRVSHSFYFYKRRRDRPDRWGYVSDLNEPSAWKKLGV